VHKRLDSLVRTGKQSVRTRKTELVCDARMVVHAVVITCSEWITCTVKCCVLSMLVLAVVLCYFLLL
jgi:hypothetical protein